MLIMCDECKNKGKMCEFNAEYTWEALYHTISLANFHNDWSRKQIGNKEIRFDFNFICKAFEKKEATYNAE